MARTDITVETMQKPLGYVAWETFLFNSMDSTNGNKFKPTGKDLIVFYNSDASQQSATVVQSDDPFSRSEDVQQNMGTDEYYLYGPIPKLGYIQKDGYVYLDASNDNVKVAIFSLK
jgi:hypothetical protein